MSEFLGEAQVRITPDTTRFRAELIAEVTAATRGVTAPVSVVPTITSTGLTAVAAQAGAAASAQAQAAGASRALSEEHKRATKESAAHARQLGQVRTAALASAASITGLRGAVLTAGATFLTATVGIQAFSRAVSSAADLEQELNVFRVTARATADEMERVSERAKELGRDLTLPGVTATDAAQTFLALSRAGLSVENALDGARGVLQLAVAAQINFADAAQITASALNAFALQGEEAISVADLLTNAANASQASIADMGIALRQSAAIADLAGFSLSETVTFLTQLARAGLLGSDAGTSFRVSIQRLIAPTEAARQELQRLNVNLRDAAGNLRPEAFFELGRALERMGRAQGDLTRQTIFGNDASRAAAFFARLNAQAFREQERELTRAGAAAEVAGARNAGFSGSVENLRNQLAALGIEIGEVALPVLGAGADAAAFFFGALANQIAETREVFGGFGEDIGKIAGAIGDLTRDSDLEEFFGDVEQGAGVFARGLRAANSALESFIGDLNPAEDAADGAGVAIRKLSEEERRFAESIHDAIRPTVEQTSSFDGLAAAAARAAAAVARLQGQQRGLEEQTARARIAGDEQAELAGLRAQRAALEEELEKQEAIIARPGTKGEAAAREAIRKRILPQLEAVNNEINNILEGQKAENERITEDAARAASDRDRALIAALSERREDAERAASAAADTTNVRDDIRAQNVLQALIKEQIQKIRERVRDEKLRRATIRELRQALEDSQREEERLREEQRREAQERQSETAAQRAQSLELDIELADINENDRRRIALRRRRISQLRREARILNLEGNALKENRNERARIRREIEEILKEEREGQERISDERRFFDFLQTQQGFTANLLGNLIPLGSTAGLVGGQSAAPVPERGVRARAAVEAAREQGVSPGQFGELITIQRSMLQAIIRLSRGTDHPEAVYQRRAGSASFDTVAL